MVKFQFDTPSTSVASSMDEKRAKRCDCSACNICKFFCREQQYILKVLLIVVNISIVMTIIAANTVKLNKDVHATRTSLKVNQSLFYPAVTICQNPATRQKSAANMLQRKVIEDVQLNKLSSEIAIKNYSTSSLIYGQCDTLVPQLPVDNVGKRFGYTINVTYDVEPIDDYKLFGWHIFIHETVHKFDDHCIDDGRADYLYLHGYDEMHVKVKATHFERETDCAWNEEVEECYENCFKLSLPGGNGSIGGEISVKENLNENEMMNRTECTCPRVCDLTTYDTFVDRRIALNDSESSVKGRLMIYYTEKRFLNIREKTVYEWPQFLADLCAVISFFIGLTMMSIFNILYKFFSMACCSKATLEDSVKSALNAGSRKQSTVL
ncbi:uncharacterized protein LOC134828433 [Culicoides brevitarsis]|uniref:uncharacterized protein LOC134828433 n=1 Tax=Culicoides brevitarsis TaxID=469753 RepID=UPI00307B2BC8